MQVLTLTPSEKLTLEQALLNTFGKALIKNHQGDHLGSANMTTMDLTTVSTTRAAVTFIYTHDDTNLVNPGVWQLNINRLRMYFDDTVMAIFERHGIVNN